MRKKEHIHYWLCEPPNGEFSTAVCKYCGDETKFRNSPKHITMWSRKTKLPKGHGLTKTQLEKEMVERGEDMISLPRTLESDSTKRANREKEQAARANLALYQQNKRRKRNAKSRKETKQSSANGT